MENQENQENQNQQQNFQNKKINIFLIYSLFFLAIIFILTLFFLKSFEKNQPKKENFAIITPTPTNQVFKIEKTNGVITIHSLKNQYNISEEIEIDLKADIEKENIVGYDVVLSYDEKNLEYLKTESLIPSFSIYSYKKDNNLFLTGVKTPQNTEKTILKNTAFAKVFFRSKNKGIYKIDIISSKDSSKTKLVNDKTQEFYPQLSSITIEVE